MARVPFLNKGPIVGSNVLVVGELRARVCMVCNSRVVVGMVTKSTDSYQDRKHDFVYNTKQIFNLSKNIHLQTNFFFLILGEKGDDRGREGRKEGGEKEKGEEKGRGIGRDDRWRNERRGGEERGRTGATSN